MLNFPSLGRDLPLASLLNEIRQAQPAGATGVVGVDGRAGAGKSTLCRALQAIDPQVAIVRADDFYVPPPLKIAPQDEVGDAIDWRRILDDVATPLLTGRTARYRRFDWASQALDGWNEVGPGGIVLLDGVYMTREEIAPLLALCIWIEVPRELGLTRGIARDGPESEDWWMHDWVEHEDRYVLLEAPGDRADIVIDGSVPASLYARGMYRRLR